MSLDKYCKNQIKIGSKSFSFASFFLGRMETKKALYLYSWCRSCDDEIDDPRAGDEEKKIRLKKIMDKTQACFAQSPDQNYHSDYPFLALSTFIKQTHLPSCYPLFLLEAMNWDLQKRSYQNISELKEYCFRVAGCVGLMMCYALGVSHVQALSHAVFLGNAMQLTNIARDVKEDKEQGRCYLPLDKLSEGLTEYEVVQFLLNEASVCYQQGRLGLKYLSFRSALAVAIASTIYEEIGKQILKKGPNALQTRMVVSFARKLLCCLKGLGLALKTLPYRLKASSKKVSLEGVQYPHLSL